MLSSPQVEKLNPLSLLLMKNFRTPAIRYLDYMSYILVGEVAAYARRWTRFNVLLLDSPEPSPEHMKGHSKSVTNN
jgi:hypothetical protein